MIKRALVFISLAVGSIIFLFGFSLVSNAASVVSVSPGDNLLTIVDSHPEGTTFIFEPGIYYTADYVDPNLTEKQSKAIHPKSSQIFIGKPGAILSGASRVTDWQTSGSVWVSSGYTHTPWMLYGNSSNQHCSTGNPGIGCGQAHSLWVNNTRFLNVDSVSKVGPGKWFFDYANDRIYIGTNPGGKTVELGTVSHAFYARTRGGSQVKDVQIKGLILEKFVDAISTDTAFNASTVSYPSWIVEQNVIRYNHQTGISIAAGAITRNNYIHDNGIQGVGGWLAHDSLTEGNEISHSNMQMWGSYGWNAAGLKIGNSNKPIVRGNYSHSNTGRGIWHDVSQTQTGMIVEENIVVNNTVEGIMDEVGWRAIIRNNVSKWNEGNQIELRNVKGEDQIYGNTIVARRRSGAAGGIIISGGARVVDDGFEVPEILPVLNNRVYDNTIIYESNEPLSGIFIQCKTDCTDGYIAGMLDTNSFNGNRYHIPSAGTSWRFGIGGKLYDFAGVQALGHETTGTLSSNIPKQSGFARPRISITAPSSSITNTDPLKMSASVSGIESGDYIKKVEFFVDGQKIAQDTYEPYSVTWYTPTNGSHILKVRAITLHDGHISEDTKSFTIGAPIVEEPTEEEPKVQSPFKTHIAPIVIQAEDYDKGGQNLSYLDLSPGNAGGAYRADDVDVKVTSEGGYAVGWIEQSEWLEYTFSAPKSGIYNISARVGSKNIGRTFSIDVDGNVVASAVPVPAKADWDQYETVSAGSVTLPAGAHILRFTMGDTNYIDLNWIKIEGPASKEIPPSETPPEEEDDGGGSSNPKPPVEKEKDVEHVPPSVPGRPSGGGGGGGDRDVQNKDTSLITQTTMQTQSSYPQCSFVRDLTLGSQGSDVTCLQNFLTKTGHYTYSGGATGYFGPVTQSAVASWQRSRSIYPPEGYFGASSRAGYKSQAVTSIPTTQVDSSVSRVQVLQRIQELLALIQVLKQQLALQTGSSGTVRQSSIVQTSLTPKCAFTRDLTLGSQGSDVTCLQTYLKSTGHYSYPDGATGYFGPVTQSAVASWQIAQKISPANGIFGVTSRSLVGN